ncbi:hypothetical protein D9M70_617460 [compost metagenome]
MVVVAAVAVVVLVAIAVAIALEVLATAVAAAIPGKQGFAGTAGGWPWLLSEGQPAGSAGQQEDEGFEDTHGEPSCNGPPAFTPARSV